MAPRSTGENARERPRDQQADKKALQQREPNQKEGFQVLDAC